MKILLINPPNCGRSIPEDLHGIPSIKQIFRGEPLALEVLAGNLAGHDVSMLDLKVEPEALAGTLRHTAPDVVGITAVTCEANTACRIAQEVKSRTPATVVVGGIHASADPAFFNRPEIDHVVVGIGKASFRELVDALERGEPRPSIPGVANVLPDVPLVFEPRHFTTADLVEEQPPRYDLVARYRPQYTLLGQPLGFVGSAVGCPYACHFCCISAQAGGQYLSCSIPSVVRDIRLLADVPFIRLVDANTFGNPAQAWALCRAIQEADLGKRLFGDVRSDTVVRHPDLMRAWRDAGLRTVVIGLEEIADDRLKAMNKANTAQANIEAMAILKDLGITLVGDFIVSPDAGHEDFDALLRFIDRHPIDLPIFTVMTPLPGTVLHQSLRDRITNHDLDYYTLANAVVPTRLPEREFYARYAELFHRTHPKAGV